MREQSGKIEQDFFNSYIKDRCGRKRSEVSVSPQFGVDVAVVDLPNGLALAMATDPISLIHSIGMEKSAWLSVQVTANDIATTGFTPMYGQFVMNLPNNLSNSDFKNYWNHIHKCCDDIGIAITGGHTGFIETEFTTTPGGITLITVANRDEILTSTLAHLGDVILVTKSCAISASAILALCFPETVRNKIGIENFQKAEGLFYDISSLKDAMVAMEEARSEITAMHDVTEGGVLGAIYELATASNNGAIIYDEKMPVDETQSQICELFSLDPRHTLGAGSMIITCKRGAVKKIIDGLKKENIVCAEVGEIKPKEEGIKIEKDGRVEDLIYMHKDLYWESFFNAMKRGWK